jgi:hypothetical protein
MKRFFLLMGATAGLLGLTGTATHASSTTASPPAWSYSFNVAPNSQVLSTVGNNGSLAITGAQGVSATGSSVVTLASLQLSSTAATPDSAVLASNGWSGQLTLHDGSSSATLTMSGSFTGPMTGTTGTPATFSGSNANVYFNPASLSITPGAGWSTVMGSNGQIADYVWKSAAGNTYTIPVADLSFTPPGIPQSSTTLSPTQLNGAIAATIEVNAGSGGGTIPPGGGGNPPPPPPGGGHGASTPEPSTLVLSCFGLGFAGLASWRRRRTLAARLA